MISNLEFIVFRVIVLDIYILVLVLIFLILFFIVNHIIHIVKISATFQNLEILRTKHILKAPLLKLNIDYSFIFIRYCIP